MKLHLYDKIISPHITEKSTNLSEQNKIIFKVPSKANKVNLKKNVVPFPFSGSPVLKSKISFYVFLNHD